MNHLPLHEYLRDHARSHPNRAAIIWYGRNITYGELDRYSDRIAVWLTQLGVHSGDRVALYLGNCPQYVMAFLGAQKIGAIVTPVSPAFKAWELEYQLQNCGATVLITENRLFPHWQTVRLSVPMARVLVTNYREFLPEHPVLPWPLPDSPGPSSDDPGVDSWQVLEEINGDPPHVTPRLDQVSLMMYTSGSTGMPKGAMLTYDNALFKAAAGSEANGATAEDIFLTVMPLSHIAGLLMGLNVPIYLGATQVMLHQFDPDTVIAAIDQYHCTFWYSVAPMNRAVLDRLNPEDVRMRSLRHNLCTSFGIPLTEPLAAEWLVKTKAIIHEAAYGLTETHTADTYMPVNGIRWGSVGKPIQDTKIRIVDPNTGDNVASGDSGEIWIKNRGVFAGYWNQPEATQKTLKSGFVATGDMGYLDADGYLYFQGRLKEMIKVSGYSVFPEDVEELLIRHPAIQQVAVIGKAHPYRGEIVAAFVVLKHGTALSPEELVDWAKNHMADYKVPREVFIVPALPVSATGKVMRRLLKTSSDADNGGV